MLCEFFKMLAIGVGMVFIQGVIILSWAAIKLMKEDKNHKK